MQNVNVKAAQTRWEGICNRKSIRTGRTTDTVVVSTQLNGLSQGDKALCLRSFGVRGVNKYTLQNSQFPKFSVWQ